MKLGQAIKQANRLEKKWLHKSSMATNTYQWSISATDYQMDCFLVQMLQARSKQDYKLSQIGLA